MARLPTHLEVSGLMRRAEAEGGFAMVLAKGERDAGTLLVVFLKRDGTGVAYERMPQLDGTRGWSMSKAQDPADRPGFSEFLERRKAQDPDLWIVELDVREVERFIETLP